SQGIAFDPKTGTLAVSEKSAGMVTLYPNGEAPSQPVNVAGPPSEPGHAVEGQVLRYAHQSQLGVGGEALNLKGGKPFEFGDNDNGVAVAPNGTAYVLSGKGDGTVWAF